MMFQKMFLSLILLLVFFCATAKSAGCDRSVAIQMVHIIAVTSGDSKAGTDDYPEACMKFKNGNNYCKQLQDLPGSDMERKQGDWWEMTKWNQRTLCDIMKFGFKARNGGNDGWKIKDLAVIVQGNNGRAYVAVYKKNANVWVDWNDKSSQREQWWSIDSEFADPLPSPDKSTQSLKVIFIANTKEESDDNPTINFRSNNVPQFKKLPNLEGDDMKKHRADLWDMGNDFYHMQANKITEIFLTPNGNDGVTFDKCAVLIQTRYGWYVPVLSIGKEYTVDKNVKSEKRADLDKLGNWNPPPAGFKGFTDTIGYWKSPNSANGDGDSYQDQTWWSTTKTDTSSEELMQSFTDSTTQTHTAHVSAGGKIKGVVEVKADYTYANARTVSDTVATKITNSVSNSASTGKTMTCTWNSPAPAGENIVLWRWYVGRRSGSKDTDIAAELITCDAHFKWGPNKSVEPNCIPGTCKDMECIYCDKEEYIIDPAKTIVGEDGFANANCGFRAVSASECPCDSGNRKGCDLLQDCHDFMAENEMCEANKPVKGISNYNINNCPGYYDVFIYECNASATNPTKKPTAKPVCKCAGVTNSQGRGGSSCKSTYKGKKWCYTKKNACSDGMFSSKKGTHEWSYKACKGATNPTPKPVCKCAGVTNSEGRGSSSCKSTYKGKKWCYTKKNACSDSKDSKKKLGYGWSWKACKSKSDIAVGIAQDLHEKNMRNFQIVGGVAVFIGLFVVYLQKRKKMKPERYALLAEEFEEL